MSVGAFVDESGNDGRSPVMVLAALVATTDQWKVFCDAWQNELNASPEVKCFKSSDAARLAGYFHGFAREQAEAKTDRLAAIIVNGIKFGVVELVYNDEFSSIVQERLYRPERKLADEVKDPYFFLFDALVKNVIREQISLGQKIDFTFDDYSAIGRRCLRRINDGDFTRLLPDGYKDLIGRAIPGKDEEFPPVQAADLVAGQFRRFIASTYFSRFRNAQHVDVGRDLKFRDFDPWPTIAKLWESGKILKAPITGSELEALVTYVNVTWGTVVLSRIKRQV